MTNINTFQGLVGIGTDAPSSKLTVNAIPTHRASYDHSLAPMTITNRTVTSSTILNDPKHVLNLAREGTTSEAFGANAAFKLSRWENNGLDSRTRLDLNLAHNYYDDQHIMTFRSDGKVGIGTNAPGSKLDVNDSTSSTTNKTLTLENPHIFGYNTGLNIGNSIVSRGLWQGDGVSGVVDMATIQMRKENNANYGDSYLSFQTRYETDRNNGGAGTLTEKMRIAGNGNVGIGTTSPLSVLTVKSNYSGGTSSGFCLDAAASAQVYNLRLSSYVQGSSQVGYIFTVNNISSSVDALSFGYNGNVGIGTNAPAYTLDINGTTQFRAGQIIRSGLANNVARPAITDTLQPYEIRASALGGGGNVNLGSGSGFLRIGAGGAVGVGDYISYIDLTGYSSVADMNRNIVFGTSETERMRIDSGGNVGIGTNAPGAQLQIGPKDNDHLFLASVANNYGWILDTDDQGSGSVPFRIKRRTAGTDSIALTIRNENGNVGIGTTAPTTALDVSGTVTATQFNGNTNGAAVTCSGQIRGGRINTVSSNFYIATNTVTTVHTISSATEGWIFVQGQGQIYAGARFSWRAGWTPIIFSSLMSGGVITWQTDGGSNIWIQHNQGAHRSITVRVLNL